MSNELPKMWTAPDGVSGGERLPTIGFTVADGLNGKNPCVAFLLRLLGGEQKTAIVLYDPADVDTFIQMLLRHKRIAWPEAP